METSIPNVGVTNSVSNSTAAGDLASVFDRAITAQKLIQQVSVTYQPQLDAAKEKPR